MMCQSVWLIRQIEKKILECSQSERDFSSVGHTSLDLLSRLSAAKVQCIEIVHWCTGDFWLVVYLMYLFN